MAVITVPLPGRDAIDSSPRMIRSRSCIVDNPRPAADFVSLNPLPKSLTCIRSLPRSSASVNSALSVPLCLMMLFSASCATR